MDSEYSSSHTSARPEKHHQHQQHQPDNSELFASAKLVAGAVQATFAHESDKVDKGRVAGAAADLLDAASHYGKLEGNRFGEYLEKAEDYLHKYESSHSSSGHSAAAQTHHASAYSGEGGGEEEQYGSGGYGGHTSHHSTNAPTHHGSAHSGSEEDSGSGGYGEYIKMAQGFLGSGGGSHSESGGGYGEYVKLAQGFLKKH